MKSEDFISLARIMNGQLADKPDCASVRTVASRSYYGAFHMAMDLLVELGCAPESDNHGQVRNILSSCGNSDASVAADALRDMHGDRIKADYRLSDTKIETSRFAELSVETATEFTSTLDALRKSCADSHFRHNLVAAIQQYAEITKIRFRQ